MARDASARLRAVQYGLPEGAFGAIERARWRVTRGKAQGVEPPGESARPGGAAVRILIAPANFAGQASQWARAARTHLPDTDAETWTYASRATFPFPADHLVPREIAGLPRAWHARNFSAVAENFTHVIIESGRPLFGPLFRHDVAREVAALREAGLGVALLWHGTDIRLPSRERRDNPWSPFHDRAARAHVAALEARVRRNARLAERAEAPQLYSTTDLHAHVPTGVWLPVAVEADTWIALPPPTDAAPPLNALYLPSNPWIKGGPQVRTVLDACESAGLITQVARERVDPAQVPALVARSHVVLDQFRLNLYGVAAVEAMLAQRPVVSLAGSPLREATKDLTGEDLPLVPTTVEQLLATLTTLSADADLRSAHARAGAQFAKRWHDGRASADAIAVALEL